MARTATAISDWGAEKAYFAKTLQELYMRLIMRTDVNAGTLILQAAIKEDVELTGVVEDNLTRER